MGDLAREEEIRRISLIKFIEGGAAMLAALEINHQKDIVGNRVRSPFDKKSLRVLVVSWAIPAKEKRAGDERPWAKIIVRAPAHP